MSAILRYTCVGSVRGSCGHRHRTYSGAAACLQQDRATCKQQGGYSDRIIEGRDECGEPVAIDENGNEQTAETVAA